MKTAKYGCIAISLVFCTAGILVILLPTPSAFFIEHFLGMAMLAFGVIKLIGYFSKDLFRLAFQYDLQFGLLFSFLGGLILFCQQNATGFSCIAYGISSITDSLFKFKTAWDARHFGIRQWWLTLSLSILSGLAGMLITIQSIVLPFQITRSLLGCSLLAVGLLNLSITCSMVKIIHHQLPDNIDAKIYENREEKN